MNIKQIIGILIIITTFIILFSQIIKTNGNRSNYDYDSVIDNNYEHVFKISLNSLTEKVHNTLSNSSTIGVLFFYNMDIKKEHEISKQLISKIKGALTKDKNEKNIKVLSSLSDKDKKEVMKKWVNGDFTDKSKAPEIGKQLCARFVIHGEVVSSRRFYRVSIRCTDLQEGALVNGISSDLKIHKSLFPNINSSNKITSTDNIFSKGNIKPKKSTSGNVFIVIGLTIGVILLVVFIFLKIKN